MMPGYDQRQIKARLLIWWIIWAAPLVGLTLIYLFLRGDQPPLAHVPPKETLTGLIGLVPLFISIVIRWLMLPRYTKEGRALVIFIIGIALAEGCGLLGTFIGGPYRDSLFLLGLLGIAQYVPFYAKKLFDPKGAGFIPNN